MPYIYTKYKIIWDTGTKSEDYTLEMVAKGTAKELQPKTPFSVRKSFERNINARMNERKTQFVWERELRLEPGEAKPNDNGLPDSCDKVYRKSKTYQRSPRVQHKDPAQPKPKSKSKGSEPATWVEDYMKCNADRAEQGKPPLSYGYWSAGFR